MTLFASIKLTWALRKRKAIRLTQQADAKRRYWDGRRRAWERDPLRGRT